MFDFHKVVYQDIAGEVETFVLMYREFHYESTGERILKIGPHLPNSLSNIKWLSFLRHSVMIRAENDSKCH